MLSLQSPSVTAISTIRDEPRRSRVSSRHRRVPRASVRTPNEKAPIAIDTPDCAPPLALASAGLLGPLFDVVLQPAGQERRNLKLVLLEHHHVPVAMNADVPGRPLNAR